MQLAIFLLRVLQTHHVQRILQRENISIQFESIAEVTNFSSEQIV